MTSHLGTVPTWPAEPAGGGPGSGRPKRPGPTFEGRGQFAEFAPESLEAFLSGAFDDNGDGTLRLACDPEDEARMYEAALAHDTWGRLPNVNCPARLLGGGRSPALPPRELAQIAGRLPAGVQSVWPSMAHFGPFEAPSTVADDISGWAVSPG